MYVNIVLIRRPLSISGVVWLLTRYAGVRFFEKEWVHFLLSPIMPKHGSLTVKNMVQQTMVRTRLCDMDRHYSPVVETSLNRFVIWRNNHCAGGVLDVVSGGRSKLPPRGALAGPRVAGPRGCRAPSALHLTDPLASRHLFWSYKVTGVLI